MIKEIEFKDHDEWLSIRSNYIGGSDAGAVIGLNPYKSAYTLWAEKTGKIPGFEGNIATKVGAHLEDLVAKLFEEETGNKVRRKNRTLVNDLYPFACANVDRLVVGEKAFLEIKTTTSIPIIKQTRGTEVPVEYYSQLIHYMAVTGLEKAYLAVLVNCRELKVFELERDQAEIDALMEAESNFWRCVETNTPPAIDGSDSTSDTILQLYPNSDGNNIDLFGFDSSLELYTALGNQIKELKTLQDEQANIIKAYMQEAERGESAKFKVTLKTQTRKTFDTKAYIKDHGAGSLDGYYKETISRPFKVTKKGA